LQNLNLSISMEDQANFNVWSVTPHSELTFIKGTI
jgi:hypothetical protein